MTDAAIQVRDVSKLYRRFLHKNQFKTLKSALLSGSLLGDLAPSETFHGTQGRLLRGAARLHVRRDR